MPAPTNEKDLLQPPHMLQEGEIFGSPYHGLVQGGILPVSGPNPDIAWPQPNDGSTRVIGGQVPAPVRNPTQAASDTANGFEWKNTAILAGNGYRLHGTSLVATLPNNEASSIYIDDNNVPWLMKITGVSGPSASNFRLNVTLVAPFGRFRVNLGLDPEDPFDIPLISDFDPVFSNTMVTGQGTGGTAVINRSTLGNPVEQTKKGDEIVVHVITGARYGLGRPGVFALLKVVFSGNGDLEDGSGISAVASVFKDQDECYFTGTRIFLPLGVPPVTAADSRPIDEMWENDIFGADDCFSEQSVVIDPADFCDVACTPFPCEVIAHQTSTHTRDWRCILSADDKFTDNAEGNNGADGELTRETFEDETTSIMRAYYDNDVLTTIGMHTSHIFRSVHDTQVNLQTPTGGGPDIETAYFSTSVVEHDLACVATGGIPDRTVEIREPIDRTSFTTDFQDNHTWDLKHTIESDIEFLINEVPSGDTLTFKYTRHRVATRVYTDDGQGSVSMTPAELGLFSPPGGSGCVPPNPSGVAFARLCTRGANDSVGTDETKSFSMTLDHSLEINGVEVFSYQEINEEDLVETRHLTSLEKLVIFDSNGPNGPVLRIENPTDADFIAQFDFVRIFETNKIIGMDVLYEIDVDGSGPGMFEVNQRYSHFSSTDHIQGEVDDFASIDPDTGLITQSTAPLCFV